MIKNTDMPDVCLCCKSEKIRHTTVCERIIHVSPDLGSTWVTTQQIAAYECGSRLEASHVDLRCDPLIKRMMLIGCPEEKGALQKWRLG